MTVNDVLHLYHGSIAVIEKPVFGKGNPGNDFGPGFYCTESENLAKEWACAFGYSGYANSYTLDVSGLRILRIEEMSVMEWLSVLLENRAVTIHDSIGQEAVEYIRRNFHVKLKGYDVLTGYRADDRYFTFVKQFVNNGIGIRTLAQAMKLGNLGIQVVVKSRRAFDHLEFTGSQPAEESVWAPVYKKRMDGALRDFDRIVSTSKRTEDVYVIDILREGMTVGDPRLL